MHKTEDFLLCKLTKKDRELLIEEAIRLTGKKNNIIQGNNYIEVHHHSNEKLKKTSLFLYQSGEIVAVSH